MPGAQYTIVRTILDKIPKLLFSFKLKPTGCKIKNTVKGTNTGNEILDTWNYRPFAVFLYIARLVIITRLEYSIPFGRLMSTFLYEGSDTCIL